MSLTIKQIAEKLNISPSATYYFLDTHPELEAEYLLELKGRFTGGRRPKLYKDEIAFAISNVKNIKSLKNNEEELRQKKEIAKDYIDFRDTISLPETPLIAELLLQTVEILEKLQAQLIKLTQCTEELASKQDYISLDENREITKQELRAKINLYCDKNRIGQGLVYSRLYDEILFRHSINIMAIANAVGKSGLEVAESRGLIAEISDIFDSMFK